MAKKQTKQIRVEDEIYYKLLDYKKGKSFNEIIGQMISYFMKTGASPVDVSASPFLDFKKDIERIVRIIKAQEKQYFSQIGDIKNFIEKGKKDYLSAHLEEVKNSFVGDSLTAEELNQFFGEFENLKLKNERLNILVEKQKKEIDSSKRESSNTTRAGGKIFLELFENLKENGKFEGNNFIGLYVK